MKKIVNVKKFIISNVVLLLIVLTVLCTILNITYSYNETKLKTVYIGEGDTLWSIALSEKEHNEYYKNKDVRYIVQNLKSVNNLSVSNLEVNQKLLIPTY